MVITQSYVYKHGLLTRFVLEQALAQAPSPVTTKSLLAAWPKHVRDIPPRINITRTLLRLQQQGILKKEAAGVFHLHPDVVVRAEDLIHAVLP